jgi:hypothetical protein
MRPPTDGSRPQTVSRKGIHVQTTKIFQIRETPWLTLVG